MFRNNERHNKQCEGILEYSASRRYKGALVTVTNVVSINPLVTVTKGWGPNAGVRIRMTLSGRRRYKEMVGYDPGNIFQCTLWVAMAQLGPLMNSGDDVVFSDIELVENDH